MSDLSKRLRYAASRIPYPFSIGDEIFQLLTEAADELDRRESLTLRLQEAAEAAEAAHARNFSALFREAAMHIEGLEGMQRKAYLDGRKSAFLEVLGSIPEQTKEETHENTDTPAAIPEEARSKDPGSGQLRRHYG